MSERQIADSFDRWLRAEGLVFRRDRMDKATTCIRGWPDFEIIANGRVLLIELKTEKGRLSRDQLNLHKRLSDTGTAVHVCRTIEAACLLVQQWVTTLIRADLPGERLLNKYGAVWRETPSGYVKVRNA